jgi:ATP-binding cassette subfamily C protein CydD
VPQQPTIFRGTVADNIALGRPEAEAAAVREAAELAGAAAFVRELPDGFDTVVGDGGRPLSSGERRRVGLARAFLRDAPLVVLDEPTADLDPASAELVGRAIERLRRGRTMLLIAHRPELARRADRVVALEAGRAALQPARAAA